MTFLNSYFLYTFTIVIALLLLLISSSSSFDQQRPSSTITAAQGLLMENKIRLGSTPPSCHNKCNECHPCVAVQAPTLPSLHDRVKPGLGRTIPMEVVEVESSLSPASSPLTSDKKYSNYKPLGWKCRCGGSVFNP